MDGPLGDCQPQGDRGGKQPENREDDDQRAGPREHRRTVTSTFNLASRTRNLKLGFSPAVDLNDRHESVPGAGVGLTGVPPSEPGTRHLELPRVVAGIRTWRGFVSRPTFCTCPRSEESVPDRGSGFGRIHRGCDIYERIAGIENEVRVPAVQDR